MRRIAARGACAALLLAAPAAAGAAEQLQIRAASLLPDSVQLVLERVAEPTRRTLRDGDTVEGLLRAHCGGSFSAFYRERFIAANGGAAAAPMATRQGRELLLPACARVGRNVPVPVQPDEHLERVLLRATGAGGATPAYHCEEQRGTERCAWIVARDLVARRNGGARAGLDALAPGRVLELPYVTQPTVIRLRGDRRPEDAARELENAAEDTEAGRALLQVGAAPGLDLFQAIQDGDTRIGAGRCSGANEDWPFNAQRVRAAIADGRAHRIANHPYGPPVPSVVRIADTGVRGIGAAGGFPLSVLAPNPQEPTEDRLEDRNRPRNRYAGDRYGINPEWHGDVRPIEQAPSPWHGTEVAHLALGGRRLHAAVPEIGELVRLNFARMYRYGSREPVTAMLTEALSVGPELPHIINLSMGGPRPIHGAEAALDAMVGRKQLLVLAAGNDGLSLAQDRVYPAEYIWREGARRATLLIVGAHDIDGVPLAFSNHGHGYVHLLAPGCGIEPAGTEVSGRLNGTSFAAPLVSFTVATIRALLAPDNEPARLTERLRLTVRHMREPDNSRTEFGGVLDIEAAVRVFDDVVRRVDGRIVAGRWAADTQTAIAWCAAAGNERPEGRAARTLALVQVVHDGGAPLLRLTFRNQEGVAQPEEAACRPAIDEGPTLIVSDRETGAVSHVTFGWREIAAFIPAHSMDDRRGVPVAPAAAVAAIAAAAPQIVAQPRPALPIAPALAPAPPRGPQEAVRILQESLTARGFDAGVPDGRPGPATTAAIRQLQSARGEAPTGVLTLPQLRVLVAPE